MTVLIHPVTGLRALGMGKRGPIWPILGGSEEAPPVQPDPVVPPAPVVPAPAPVKGFPDGVAIAEMTEPQQAAYWKHYARQHEDTVKAFGGLTPKQVAEMQTRIKTLETEKLSDDEKALASAKDEASAAARTVAEAEWRPKYQAAQLEATAGRILDDEQLKSFMAIVDASKFIDANTGDIDRDAVMGHLTALYGQPKQREFGSALPQHANWGQYGAQRPGTSGAEQANAQLARRHGVKNHNS
jgi:hypothetical protein